MSQERTFQYRPQRGPGFDRELAEEAMRLHEAGWSNVAIGKKLGRHNSNIQRLLKKMSRESVSVDMKDSKITPNSKAQRVYGQCAPETTEGEKVADTKKDSENNNETLEQKVARLEQELKDATLMRDFYNEMINVAEKQFSIRIRKKAGTRR